MPRPPKQVKLPNGRPKIIIDWDYVDKLLIAGCHGTEIASALDCHPQTFYDRVIIEKGMGFTEYSQKRKEKGDTLLRQAQFSKALKGDNTMLIWLGKIRLGQRDPDKGDTFVISNEQAAAAMKEILDKTKDPLNNGAGT